MSSIRPIRTETDYDSALAQIESLMNAAPNTEAADTLDVLATLVEDYETKHFPIESPDPLDAVLFRMEQAGLKPADMSKYLGGRARVSEILAGKRSLTLTMIRALNTHLGIPAASLIGNPRSKKTTDKTLDLSKFPLREMKKRNWFPANNSSDEEKLQALISMAGGRAAMPSAFYKKTTSPRLNARTDPFALQAWCMKIQSIARSKPLKTVFHRDSIDTSFLQFLARLSRLSDGPKHAVSAIESKGVRVVYLKHLPQTYLDGAAMLTVENHPVIGLTLRHDRLDNFWFCIIHEMAHVWKHLSPENRLLIDDLELHDSGGSTRCEIEDEADQLSQDALIPPDQWALFCEKTKPTQQRVMDFAQSINVHPAVVAGRVRRETKNYRRLSSLIGSNEVVKHFEDGS